MDNLGPVRKDVRDLGAEGVVSRNPKPTPFLRFDLRYVEVMIRLPSKSPGEGIRGAGGAGKSLRTGMVLA